MDAKRRSFQLDAASMGGVPQEDQMNQIVNDITLKEREEKAAQNYVEPARIPGTARVSITNPLNKFSSNNPNPIRHID